MLFSQSFNAILRNFIFSMLRTLLAFTIFLTLLHKNLFFDILFEHSSKADCSCPLYIVFEYFLFRKEFFMSRKKKYASVIIPAVSLFLLLFLFLLSGLISLGQQLNSVSPILSWLYGLIVLACLGAGIIWPIVSVWRRPIFSMYMLRYRDGRARFYWCRKLTDNLKKNTELTNEETAQLEDFLKQGNQADDLLIDFFTEKLSPVIDSEIKSAAKTAFVTTAISQTAFYDMFSMLSVNLHLIRTIVESCGYRPSGASLLGLYVRILKATFLAGGLEEMDLEELLPLVTGNAAMKLPGLVFASAAQGTVNAFMTIRVGILTKKYLFSADGPIEMPQARKDSYKEAIDFLKKCELHKDVIAIAKKTAQGAKEAAAASVKKVFKSTKTSPLT